MNFWEEFLKPFNLVSLAITLFSIALAVVFFRLSQKKKIIAYIKSDKASRIYDSEVSSPKIRVLDENEELINDSVYVLKATIWNAGDLPIESNEVRRPITISISLCTKILDFGIIQQPYQDIAQIKLKEASTHSEEPNTKEVQFLWEHFDPGFGATFQIIYAGKEDSEAHVTGYIVGIDELIDGSKPIVHRYISNKILRTLLGFSPLPFLILAGIIGQRLFTNIAASKSYLLVFAIVICLISGVSGYLSSMFMDRRIKPPF